MTDEGLASRYEALRQAAVAALEAAAADPTPAYIAHQRNLDALALVLDGGGPQSAVVRELQDPDVHMLSSRDYDQGLRNGAPLPFSGRAASIRRSMALDDESEHPVRYWPDEYPRLTELKAMTIGTLLQELAARLEATGDPGAAELAQVALDLADEVLAPTFAGAQRTRGTR